MNQRTKSVEHTNVDIDGTLFNIFIIYSYAQDKVYFDIEDLSSGKTKVLFEYGTHERDLKDTMDFIVEKFH